MKKALFLFGCFLLFGATLSLNAGNYRLDQAQLDQMISSAHQVEHVSVFSLPDLTNAPDNQVLTEGKDPVIALVLCTVLGWVGAHRYYLGTKPINCLIYFLLSCVAIGGILNLVDWVMLLMVVIDKKDLAPYIDNPKLIMWQGQI
jgi:TM2 domain-containing membrane protein YozV